MNRPQLTSIESWRTDDEKLNTLLESMQKKFLNIFEWEFPDPHSDKFFDFKLIVEIMKKPFPSIEELEKIKAMNRSLPAMFKNIKDDMFVVFKKFTLNYEERINYIEKIDEYTDFLEKENEALKTQIDKLEREKIFLDTLNEKRSLEAKTEELRKIIESFKNGLGVNGEKETEEAGKQVKVGVETKAKKDEKKEDRRNFR